MLFSSAWTTLRITKSLILKEEFWIWYGHGRKMMHTSRNKIMKAEHLLLILKQSEVEAKGEKKRIGKEKGMRGKQRMKHRRDAGNNERKRRMTKAWLEFFFFSNIHIYICFFTYYYYHLFFISFYIYIFYTCIFSLSMFFCLKVKVKGKREKEREYDILIS